MVGGAGVIGDRDIAVLGLRFLVKRATPDFMDGCCTQRSYGRFRRVLLHSKHEVVAILKLKGHVIPAASGDIIVARIPEV